MEIKAEMEKEAEKESVFACFLVCIAWYVCGCIHVSERAGDCGQVQQGKKGGAPPTIRQYHTGDSATCGRLGVTGYSTSILRIGRPPIRMYHKPSTHLIHQGLLGHFPVKFRHVPEGLPLLHQHREGQLLQTRYCQGVAAREPGRDAHTRSSPGKGWCSPAAACSAIFFSRNRSRRLV